MADKKKTKGNLRDFREAMELLLSDSLTDEEQRRLLHFLTTEGEEEYRQMMAGENQKKLLKYLPHENGTPFGVMPYLDTHDHSQEEGEIKSIKEAALQSKREKELREWEERTAFDTEDDEYGFKIPQEAQDAILEAAREWARNHPDFLGDITSEP